MKILIVSRSTHFHFLSGGVETQLKSLAEGLTHLKNEVVVLSTALPNSFEVHNKEKYSFITEHNVKYCFINNTTPGFYPYSTYELFLLKLRLLKKRVDHEGPLNFFNEISHIINNNLLGDFDLIISQSTSCRFLTTSTPIFAIIHGTILAELKNRFKKCKSLKDYLRFVILDLLVLLYERYTSNKDFFSKVVKVIAVSDNLKTQFLYEYPKLAIKAVTIYNGVDTNLFKPSADKFNIFTLLYVGRINREKGIDIAINAVEILKNKKIKLRLLIIGDGPEIDYLKNLVDQKNLTEEITFLGALKNNDTAGYYSKSHLFLLPTRREEGHPMTVSESLCSGLPVVCTAKGGLKNLIQNNVNGIIINDDDDKDLAEKIEYLYNNKNVLKKLSESALDTGQNKYSQSKMVELYNNLLKETYGKNR